MGKKVVKNRQAMAKDHALFASIGTAQSPREGWPLGYMGFDANQATDEVIKHFLNKK